MDHSLNPVYMKPTVECRIQTGAHLSRGIIANGSYMKCQREAADGGFLSNCIAHKSLLSAFTPLQPSGVTLQQ